MRSFAKTPLLHTQIIVYTQHRHGYIIYMKSGIDILNVYNRININKAYNYKI